MPSFVTCFQFQLQFLSQGHISANIANTLRGGFGATLREIVCTYPGISCKTAHSPILVHMGIFLRLPFPPESEVMRKYPYAPHPFLLIPPSKRMTSVKERDSCIVGMNLIGKAARYFPYVLLALKELGTKGIGAERVRFTMESIFDSEGHVVYSSQDDVLRLLPQEKATDVTVGLPEYGLFSLHFTTPLRLQVNGRISSTPTFKDIIGALSRRIMLLSYFHCGGNDQLLVAGCWIGLLMLRLLMQIFTEPRRNGSAHARSRRFRRMGSWVFYRSRGIMEVFFRS